MGSLIPRSLGALVFLTTRRGISPQEVDDVATLEENGWLLIGVSLVTLLLLAFPGAGSAGQPITISIIDNGGDLASTQVIIENYKKANPDKVKEIKIQRGPPRDARQDQGTAGRRAGGHQPSPHRPGRRLRPRRQQAAHRAVPKYDKMFSEGRADRRGEGAPGFGRRVPHAGRGKRRRAGVHLQPEEGAEAPQDRRRAADLGQGEPQPIPVCRPANSGPGRSIMAGLPFILNDKAPADPEKGWDKAWAYMKELGSPWSTTPRAPCSPSGSSPRSSAG